MADLKTFSNVDQEDFIPCDLNHLIVTACHLVEAEFSHTLTIEQRLGDVPQLAGYPAKISQALFNVLDNAAQAIANGGRVRITSRVAEDGCTEVLIEDNGCGISKEDQDRLFDPFFTTRPVGEGTGLGLSVARDIMTAHGGEILVKSKQGIGTRATLRFLSR